MTGPRAVPDPTPKREPMTAERWRTLAPPTRVAFWAGTVGVCILLVGLPLALLWVVAT